MITEDDAPALFELEHPPAPRKGSTGYLLSIAGDYGGYQLWALAPIDRYLRDKHFVRPNATDFVWLVDADRRAHWALVDVLDQAVVALDPEPLDKAVRDEIGARA